MMKQWHSCYDSGWKDIIVPEAFSHPAKMSYGLLKRILAHAKVQGWLEEGDVIVDPFGGIGSTGILGAYEGYQVVCVELEAKFVDLAKKNFELHENALEKLGCSYPIILQGDSRRLCEVVEKADCIVSSPPFQSSLMTKDKEFNAKARPGRTDQCSDYGQTPGQLGSMKPGKVDMVVSSPPYAKAHAPNTSESDVLNKNRKDLRKWAWNETTQGQTPGNLGNLKSGDVELILSSPPYEKAETGGKIPKDKYPQIGGRIFGYRQEHQGCSEGQLSQEQGDTFWQAAKTIVEQCHQILKPGGHAIWVVKSFVRNKRIVDFPGDWQRLCESVGFKTVCVHHAMLVKETTYKTLFGDTEIKDKERKSFFRRLAERSYAWNKYWQALTHKQKADFLIEGKKDCWDSYNSLSAKEKGEMLDDGFPKHPKPNKKTILSNAKCIAFIASGENIRDWNKEIRIDFEVVLCMETPK